jgi:hypothetical protein
MIVCKAWWLIQSKSIDRLLIRNVINLTHTTAKRNLNSCERIILQAGAKVFLSLEIGTKQGQMSSFPIWKLEVVFQLTKIWGRFTLEEIIEIFFYLDSIKLASLRKQVFLANWAWQNWDWTFCQNICWSKMAVITNCQGGTLN